jgi:molybdopterin-guanine dinucleotide biosynthesis protein A
MKYQTGQVNAVVLAGGINRINLYEGYTPGYKALITIAEKPLIQYTLEALDGSGRVGRTAIVGPREACEASAKIRPCDCIEGGVTLKESIYKGLKHFRESPLVLFATADLPLLTPSAVNEFLNVSASIDTPYRENLFWAVLPEASFTGPYRNLRKGFNRFRDVAVCHGNLFLMTPALSGNRRLLKNLDRIYGSRKDSARAALSIGPIVGATYAVGVEFLRLLTLGQMAATLSRYFRVGIIPVLINHPEAAADIDEPRDYLFVSEQLNPRGHQSGAR